MAEKSYNDLFICTGNSARSIPDSPRLDFVFPVFDQAGEGVWPGQPMTAHWGIEDPAAVDGAAEERAFIAAYHAMQRRIGIFLCLPLDSIDELSLQKSLDEIGAAKDAESPVAG